MSPKKTIHHLLTSLLLLTGCNNPIEDQEIKLLIPTGDEIYFGAFPDFGSTEDQVSAEKIQAFEDLVEKKIAWATFSQNWYNGITYPYTTIHTIHDAGSIPFVRLMPRSTQDEFVPETQFSLQKIIDGLFDPQLRAWARAAKADNIPLLVDFAIEPNGNWFGWSGIFNGADTKEEYGDPNYYDGPERYRDAYRHIIELFDEEEVTHITWFFHPDIHTTPDEPWNQPKLYYPGDSYIDWIGISLYGAMSPASETWELFDETLAKNYRTILDISTEKPFALLEFGVTDQHPDGDKALWIENAFETILAKEYIEFKGVSYWHENWQEESGDSATLRLDSSPEALEMFKSYIQTPLFLSQGYFSE